MAANFTSDITFFIQAFLAIFSIVNPISGVMAFISITSNLKKEDTLYVARRSVVIACIIAIIFAISGAFILDLFAITVDSLRVAGGVLLFLVAVDMIFARTTRESITTEEMSFAEQRDNISVFPMAMPMLTGPGAITTIILYTTTRTIDYSISMTLTRILVIGAILVTFVITFLIFRFSDYFTRVVGMTGMMVMTRLMGLFLGAIAVGFISDGIHGLFGLK
ncbi:MarC family integral membrane protein [uncultured archaeon]|nr:MarC family integral membrane protein [uncultured archaeon]